MTSVTAGRSSSNGMATNMAPLITMGTAWVARKGMIMGYEAITGRPAPVVARRESPVLARLAWAATMAATLAAIEIVVWRMLDSGDD